jgi:hypothetical protein
MKYFFNLYVNNILLLFLWCVLINKVSYTEELGLLLIYIGLFIIASVSMLYKKYYNIYKSIIFFILFFLMKDQIIDVLNNIYIQQIIYEFYNIKLSIADFNLTTNFKVYECQDKNFTIEVKNFIIEKGTNNYYKNIINNYILNNYISFNNNNYYIKLFTKELILSLEIFLIGLQKIIHEYINHITPLYNLYSNYKILTNKYEMRKNFENLYYNTSLNLLLDTTYITYNQKNFIIFLEKNYNRQNLELINFLTSYYINFYKMPFEIYRDIMDVSIDSLELLPEYNLELKWNFSKKLNYKFGLNYDLNINNHNIYNLNWKHDYNYILYDNLPIKLNLLNTDLVTKDVWYKYYDYNDEWLYKDYTKKYETKTLWYTKQKKIWVYESHWFKNLIHDIKTLDVTIKRLLTKIGRRLDPNRWIRLPTLEDYKKMNKSGIMQVIRKNMPDIYAGLSEEEIIAKKKEMREAAIEKAYEERKSWNRELKRRKMLKIKAQYKSARLKRLAQLRWEKANELLVKKNAYLKEFKKEYNHVDIKHYAKFKVELRNIIEATGRVPRDHVMWKALYPRQTENLLFEDPASLDLQSRFPFIENDKKNSVTLIRHFLKNYYPRDARKLASDLRKNPEYGIKFINRIANNIRAVQIKKDIEDGEVNWIRIQNYFKNPEIYKIYQTMKLSPADLKWLWKIEQKEKLARLKGVMVHYPNHFLKKMLLETQTNKRVISWKYFRYQEYTFGPKVWAKATSKLKTQPEKWSFIKYLEDTAWDVFNAEGEGGNSLFYRKARSRRFRTNFMKLDTNIAQQLFFKNTIYKILLNSNNMYSNMHPSGSLVEAQKDFEIEHSDKIKVYKKNFKKWCELDIDKANKYAHIHPRYLNFFFKGMHITDLEKYKSFDVNTRNLKFKFFSLKINNPAYMNFDEIVQKKRVYEHRWPNSRIKRKRLYTDYTNITMSWISPNESMKSFYNLRAMDNEGPFERFWSKKRLGEKNEKQTAAFLKAYVNLFRDSKSYWNKSKIFANSTWLQKFWNFLEYENSNFKKRDNWYMVNYFEKKTWEMFYTKIESVSEPLSLDIIHLNYYSKIKNTIKNTDILWKKNYIENLKFVYQYEEKPIINYILYKIRKEEFKILHKIIIHTINYYNYNILWFIKHLKEIFYEAKIDIGKRLLTNINIKYIIKYYNFLKIKNYYPYIIIIIYIFIYCVVSAAIILLIKSYLPKNLIYGINIKNFTKTKIRLEQLNGAMEHLDTIDSEDIKNLANMLKIELDKKSIKNKEVYHDLLKDIEDLNNINMENIKKLKLQKSIKKISLKKNFFDPETRYIYSWENRYDKAYYENKNLIKKGIKNFTKTKIYNKFEEKKNKDLKANYLIFYKKFFFEKNLEKWENNTKFRLENPLDWIKSINNIFFKLIKILKTFRKDKRYNHNRMVFWEDSTLDEWNKVTYVYVVPKLFFNFFFVIKFIIGTLKLWNWGYWKRKWNQYVKYGVHVKVNYKELKEHLEKEWSLEWFKKEADYGSGLYFKDMLKIIKQYEDLKKFPLNPKITEKKESRFDRLGAILNLIEEENKLIEINQYLLDIENINLDRIENDFEKKFIDINKKLRLDVTKVDPKVWMEQKVKYKYMDAVYKKKLELEKEEHESMRETLTTRGKRDRDDKKKTLQILTLANHKKLKVLMEKRKSTLEYEKKLRIYNFKNKIVDIGLDAKESRFYDSIPEYKEELKTVFDELDEVAKGDKSEDTISEKKVNTLYGSLDKNYPYYRKWTTMGARMNYILAQILMLFISWFENIKKIRKNEFNIQNIFKITWIDYKKYIYKMYWEFMILWNEHKALKNFGINIKTIFKFSLLFTPIIIYSIILYVFFILFFIKYIIFSKTKKIVKNKITNIVIKIKIILKTCLKDNIKKILNKIFFYLKFLWNILNLIFRDIETGHSLLEQLYYKLYNICGKFQRNIFFIKGAFILGYKDEKDIKKGFSSIKKYLELKFNVYKAEKKSIKQKILNKKENIKIKLELILIIIDIKTNIQNINKKILKLIYTYIFYPIFRVDWKTFKQMHNDYLKFSTKYQAKLRDNFKLLLVLKELKTWNLIKLILKNILKLLTLPFVRIIRYQQNKYLENYKKGIQGFRENPMYLVLNNPKKKNDWKLKLHIILMENKISKYLEYLLDLQTYLIDVFFIYKIAEVKWANKNYYQDFFWRKWFWYWKRCKKITLTWLIGLFKNIEENYQNFEENIETQNWTLWEKFKYAYYMRKMYKHVVTRKNQQRISRDLFFYKLAKERDKILRIYFLKGIINWITYITLNKVIYTKIKDLKPRNIEYKNFKYYIKNIKSTIHISGYIEEVPPQFWALVIIYNKYYKYLLKYVYSDPDYPTKWMPNKGLEFSKNYKWRLASPDHVADIPFFDRRFIAQDINSYTFQDLLISLTNEPYDPLIRWLLFLLEFGMTEEALIEEKDIWIDETHSKEDVWGDISLSQLLTYNEYLDEYKYEIKEFNRLIGGVDFLKIAEHTLERDKQKYYYDQYKMVKKRIVYKNEDIVKELLEERKLKKAKILHRALLRNKLKTPKEREQELEDENLKEYFYVKKKQFFEDTMTDKFWDWQAEYDSKMPEDTYFCAQDMSQATFDAYDWEEYRLYNGLLDDYSYLLNKIVLDSFDQTMEEIYAFLMNEVWKVLQNILKKDNVKSVINYKHLIIDETILSRLNFTDHIVPQKVVVHDVVTEKDSIHDTYKHRYSKLAWESTRLNPLYSFIENNIMSVYFEVGDVFMYEDKIKFNADAIKYKRTDKYHENPVLFALLGVLATRREKRKNVQRNSIKIKPFKNKNKHDEDPENFKFIQNVKWTWDQWLIFNNIDVENKLLNKNTVIFNERFHIWTLKRVPMRIKLPVRLDVDEEYMRNYYKDKSNYMEFLWHRSFLMGGTVAPILKQSLQWENCKRYLEKHFDKNIRDLIIWVFTESALNQETLKIKRDYEFVFKNFIQNYAVFHKLYFVGLAHYSWDLIRYHEIWWGQEEFPYDRYFQLKQIEFLMHDPGVKRLMERVHDVFIDRYKPISYVFFFKYQFFGNSIFFIYRIFSIASFIWLLKVLFYDQGAYVTNHYMVFAPMLLVVVFWFLRRNMEDIKDTSKGSEIYLYRYHKTKIVDELDWERKKLALAKRKQEWIENFYDKDKIQEVFGENHSFLSTDRAPGWWKEYTHLDKDSKTFEYKHMKFFAWIMASFVWCMYWRGYSWKYRNSWWIWEYYRHDEDLYLKLKADNRYAPIDFKQREWFEDSWVRLEEGGNPYTRWYENTYRKYKQIEPLQLDMGYHDWQVARNVVSPSWWYEKDFIEITGAMAEGYWIYLATLIDYHILKDLGIYRKYSFADIVALSGHQIINRRRIRKQGKFLKRHNRSLSEHYYLNRIVKEDLSIFNDNLAFRNVDVLTLMKKGFKDDLNNLRKYLIRIQWNKRYPNRVNPYKRWFDFIDWIEYWYNYNVIRQDHMYSHFLIESQAYTSKWMLEDMQRYRGKKTIFEKYIEKITNYKAQILEREKGIYADHNLSYESGKFLDMQTLLSITEKEKHYHNFCYHLIKYKLDRIIIMKKVHPEYFYKKYGLKQERFLTRRATKAQKSEFLSIEPDYLVDVLRRYGRYINNINKKFEASEIIEYKCNLLLNFWTEQKNFWILIKDISEKTGIVEFIIILINLLMKIWG